MNFNIILLIAMDADVAVKMIENNPKLAVSQNALEMLAAKPMEDKSKKRSWELYFYWG